MMIVSDAPRYMVPQKIPTPSRHINVAIKVAYGIRTMHAWQQSPIIKYNFNK